MTRWGVALTHNSTGKMLFHSIGVGLSEDEQKVHLFSSYELAEEKARQYKSSVLKYEKQGKYSDIVILPYSCNPI